MANEITILLSGTEQKVKAGAQNCGIRNDGVDTVYISRNPNIVPDADGVLSVPAGQAAKYYDLNEFVYLLGTGKVQLNCNDYSTQDFRVAATSSGEGGADVEALKTAVSTLTSTVAQNADKLTEHAEDSSIHLTAENAAALVSNPNVLINSDFRSVINQRGQTEYTDAGYTVDRWANERNVEKVIVNDGYVTFERTELSYNPTLYQRVENAAALSGKNITISLRYRTQQAHYRIRLLTQTAGGEATELKLTNLPVSEEFTTASYTFTMPEGLTALTIGIHDRGVSVGTGAVGDKIDIEWIKCEVGTYATPLTPHDPAAELARCQRYFYRFAPVDGRTLGLMGHVVPSNKTFANALFTVPVSMRAVPAVTMGGTVSVTDNTNTERPSIKTTVMAVDSGNHTYCLIARTENEMSGDTAVCALSADGYIDLDAEME